MFIIYYLLVLFTKALLFFSDAESEGEKIILSLQKIIELTEKVSCDTCGIECSNKRSLLAHINTHNSDNWRYACKHENCLKTFSKPYSLVDHMVLHNVEMTLQEAHNCKIEDLNSRQGKIYC